MTLKSGLEPNFRLGGPRWVGSGETGNRGHGTAWQMSWKYSVPGPGCAVQLQTVCYAVQSLDQGHKMHQATLFCLAMHSFQEKREKEHNCPQHAGSSRPMPICIVHRKKVKTMWNYEKYSKASMQWLLPQQQQQWQHHQWTQK